MKVRLLDYKELNDFPSGSGIEYYNENLYLVGDDAKEILILNKKWKQLDTIPLVATDEYRIPKNIKSDLEATTLVEINKIPRLLVLGSGSRDEHRDKVVLVNLDDNTTEEHAIAPFYRRLKETVSAQINIESAAIVLGQLILGNRGHKNSPDNHIIVTDVDFWKHPEEVPITSIIFELPQHVGTAPGLSGMTYSPLNDWLIMTFTTEDTTNSYDDGAIGDSYLAVVENASRKIVRNKMKVNELINLSEADAGFKGYKIESVCIQSEKEGRVKLHLVADNDTGISYLFKVRLKV